MPALLHETGSKGLRIRRKMPLLSINNTSPKTDVVNGLGATNLSSGRHSLEQDELHVDVDEHVISTGTSSNDSLYHGRDFPVYVVAIEGEAGNWVT